MNDNGEFSEFCFSLKYPRFETEIAGNLETAMDADKHPQQKPAISPQGLRRVQLSKLLGNNDFYASPTPEKNLWPAPPQVKLE